MVYRGKGVSADVTRRAVLVARHFTGSLAGTNRVITYHSDDRLVIGDDGLVTAYRRLYDNNDVLTQVPPGSLRITQPNNDLSTAAASWSSTAMVDSIVMNSCHCAK